MFEFKKRYHYVPPCPRCNSSKTGYFITVSSFNLHNLDKIIFSHLANGELVQARYSDNEMVYENAFCSDCGCEWYTNIDVFRLNDVEINNEKKKRGITNKDYTNLRNVRKTIKQKRKQLKKIQKEKLKKIKKQNKKNDKPLS